MPASTDNAMLVSFNVLTNKMSITYTILQAPCSSHNYRRVPQVAISIHVMILITPSRYICNVDVPILLIKFMMSV
jgi:hypothetical protein